MKTKGEGFLRHLRQGPQDNLPFIGIEMKLFVSFLTQNDKSGDGLYPANAFLRTAALRARHALQACVRQAEEEGRLNDVAAAIKVLSQFADMPRTKETMLAVRPKKNGEEWTYDTSNMPLILFTDRFIETALGPEHGGNQLYIRTTYPDGYNLLRYNEECEQDTCLINRVLTVASSIHGLIMSWREYPKRSFGLPYMQVFDAYLPTPDSGDDDECVYGLCALTALLIEEAGRFCPKCDQHGNVPVVLIVDTAEGMWPGSVEHIKKIAKIAEEKLKQIEPSMSGVNAFSAVFTGDGRKAGIIGANSIIDVEEE